MSGNVLGSNKFNCDLSLRRSKAENQRHNVRQDSLAVPRVDFRVTSEDGSIIWTAVAAHQPSTPQRCTKTSHLPPFAASLKVAQKETALEGELSQNAQSF